MWLNIKWYDGEDNLVRVDGDYGPIAVEWDVNRDNIVDENDTVDSIVDLSDPNTKIYEAHYGMSHEWADELINESLEYLQDDPTYLRIARELLEDGNSPFSDFPAGEEDPDIESMLQRVRAMECNGEMPPAPGLNWTPMCP